MQSSSRRAFLTGRRTPHSPWQAFCRRLQAGTEGAFYEFGMREEVGSARLVPKQASDIRKALALCAEYGVHLALDGVPHAAKLGDQHTLWVEPGRELGNCQQLEPSSPRWFVQPGCLLGELEAAGLAQFADLPCHITVAAWLADRSLCDWEAGSTHLSGVVHASVLLADGNAVSLGAFGAGNKKPLTGARLQQLIPALFQLSTGADAQACRRGARWPGRYRLDALLPAADRDVNLAHLLLGHGGDLGWVEWVVIDQRQARPHAELPYGERYGAGRAARAGVAAQAGELDSRIKSLFDPAYVFPYPGQDL